MTHWKIMKWIHNTSKYIQDKYNKVQAKIKSGKLEAPILFDLLRDGLMPE